MATLFRSRTHRSRWWRPLVAIGFTALNMVSVMRLGAQSLDSLTRLAFESHPSMESARLAVRRAEAQARGAAAWEPPSVGIEFSMLPPADPNPVKKGETMFMIEQMIPLFGQNRIMADAMALGTEVGAAELAGARRELRARVEREYYALWLLDRRDSLNGEGRRLAEVLYQAAETGYVAGTSGQSDLFRMQVEIERLATEREELRQERIEALARLNSILGRPLETPVVIASSLSDDALPPFDSLAALVGEHPDLRRMEAMATMAEAEAEAEHAMLKPMLMLRGGVAYMPEGHPVREANVGEHGLTTHGDGVMKFGLTAGAMLSIPIAPWSRSGPEAKAEALRVEALQALSDRDVMRREMLGMLRATYAQAQRAALRLAFYRNTQLPLIERTLESLRSDYLSRRVPFSSVVDGYSSLIMSRMDAYMQEMEYAMARSMLREIAARPETR